MSLLVAPERIRETIDRRDAETVASLEQVRAPVQALERRGHDIREIGDGRSFLFFETVEDLDESQRTPFNWLAYTARRLRQMMADELPISAQWTLTEIVGMLERACDGRGLTLTEDAWAWIDTEDDPELLLLLALAAMKEREQQLWNMRRALFERRAFAQAVLAASKDDALCTGVEEMIRRKEASDRKSG
jgi:hypothetical protein